MAYQVGITDYVRPPYDIEQEAFPDAKFVFLGTDREGLIEGKALQELDALMVWHMPITDITVPHLSSCRIVVRYGTGYENIHIPSLDRAGILFCNTPDYGTEEVADTACGMILDLQRRISSYDAASRQFSDCWQENLQRPIRRTHCRTLGLIGVGRIGTAVINRMKSFGYRIVGFDPHQPSGHEKAIGYHRVFTVGDLLATCDMVSIHCPLNEGTRGLINSETLALMKRGASLVNTSRGAIIANLQCLDAALRSGALSSVALDVLPEEPPPADDPLITAWRNRESWLDGRLIINPHTAYYSEEALYEMRYKASETIRLFLVEGKIRNRIPA
jgi:D-3-phosphoglycerate dehydrogenase